MTLTAPFKPLHAAVVGARDRDGRRVGLNAGGLGKRGGHGADAGAERGEEEQADGLHLETAIKSSRCSLIP